MTCALMYANACAMDRGLLGISSIALIAVAVICALAAFKMHGKQFMFLLLSALFLGAALAAAQAYALKETAEVLDYGQVATGELHLLEDSSNNGYSEIAKAELRLQSGNAVVVQARFSESMIDSIMRSGFIDQGDTHDQTASTEMFDAHADMTSTVSASSSSSSITNDDTQGVSKKGLLYGQAFTVTGTFRKIDHALDPYAWQDAVVATFQVDNACVAFQNPIVDALINARSETIDSFARTSDIDGAIDDSAALLQAITCGYRANLNESALYDGYQSCGLAHLVAVSGAHLVIVTSLFAGVFKWLRLPSKLIIVLLIVIMLSYFVLSGAPVSALRATIMSSVGILALIGKRRPSSLNALGLSILTIVAFDPAASVSLSLALSALSTLGIVLFAPLFLQWLKKTPLDHLPAVSNALALTGASAVMSQGLACSVFSLLPLISPISNIIAAPLFPLICTLGLLAGVVNLLGIPGSGLLGGLAHMSASVMDAIVQKLSDIPYAAIPFTLSSGAALALSFLVAALLWITWGNTDEMLKSIIDKVVPSGSVKEELITKAHALKRGIVGLIMASALIVVIATDPSRIDRIVMLDVGQGDAFLLQSKGQVLLVDTGNQDSKLIRALARARVVHIDMVALTHPDDDHVGSLDALKKSVQVDSFAVPQGLTQAQDDKSRELMNTLNEMVGVVDGAGAGTEADAGSGVGVGTVATRDHKADGAGSNRRRDVDRIHGLNTGDSFRVGAFTCSVLWPMEYGQGENADSLCLLVTYDGDENGTVDFTALFTGDAETEELQEIIQRNNISGIDILKVGHHGSKNALTQEQARILSPRVAFISCGLNNRYGHPSSQVIDELEEVNATILRTDIQGQIEMQLTSEELSINRVDRG